MGSELPEIGREEFARRLAAGAPDVSRETSFPHLVEALHRHYLGLRRWNPRLSLVGPGTAGELVERHYVESLAALPLLERGFEVVDVGSGGGFPGLVLAAARPDLRVTLVESRARKWSFLMSAIQSCGLSCCCLNARVGATLPEDLPLRIDALTLRGVRLPAEAVPPLVRRLAPAGRWLAWAGGGPVEIEGLREVSAVRLAGRDRRIAVLQRSGPRGGAEEGE